MTKPDHLSSDLLIRAIDDELPDKEMIRVESHLARCERCRAAYSKFRRLTVDMESLSSALPVQDSFGERDALEAKLDGARPHGNKRVRPFAWGAALAASLTIGVLVAPHLRHSAKPSTGNFSEVQNGSFEVAGELFSPLPYSNPDLPVGAPHIVRMEVPVSSLSDAGIIFEPIANQALTADSSVLADVLLGMDGQPLGVHVLSVE